MTQERLSDISLGLLSIERHFKDIGKNAIVSEYAIAKARRRVFYLAWLT